MQTYDYEVYEIRQLISYDYEDHNQVVYKDKHHWDLQYKDLVSGSISRLSGRPIEDISLLKETVIGYNVDRDFYVLTIEGIEISIHDVLRVWYER